MKAPLQILLVDDDEVDRLAVIRALRRDGDAVEITSVATLSAAREALPLSLRKPRRGDMPDETVIILQSVPPQQGGRRATVRHDGRASAPLHFGPPGRAPSANWITV